MNFEWEAPITVDVLPTTPDHPQCARIATTQRGQYVWDPVKKGWVALKMGNYGRFVRYVPIGRLNPDNVN
jgi:hypothetical protein